MCWKGNIKVQILTAILGWNSIWLKWTISCETTLHHHITQWGHNLNQAYRGTTRSESKIPLLERVAIRGNSSRYLSSDQSVRNWHLVTFLVQLVLNFIYLHVTPIMLSCCSFCTTLGLYVVRLSFFHIDTYWYLDMQFTSPEVYTIH